MEPLSALSLSLFSRSLSLFSLSPPSSPNPAIAFTLFWSCSRKLAGMKLCALALVVCSLCLLEAVTADDQRPVFHALPPSMWINDPNGPIYINGTHHLFFQYNPEAGKTSFISFSLLSLLGQARPTHGAPVCLEQPVISQLCFERD